MFTVHDEKEVKHDLATGDTHTAGDLRPIILRAFHLLERFLVYEHLNNADIHLQTFLDEE